MSELVLFVVLMIAAGYALRKAHLVRADVARDLNQLVFYLALPPLIFLALHRARLGWGLLVMPALAWGVVLVGLGVGSWLARRFKLERSRGASAVLAATLGNTTYFGYPLAHAFYGDQGLTLAIFYDMLGATLAVNTLGVWYAASASQARPQPGAIVRRLMAFPPLWALVLGLGLHGVALPPLLETLLQRLGDLTAPLIMLSIGLSLNFRHWREDWPLVSVASAARLLGLPLLVWGVTSLLHLPHAYQQVAVLQAAMPTMFYTLTLASVFELRTPLVVNAIMVTTVLSFLLLPLWHFVLR